MPDTLFSKLGEAIGWRGPDGVAHIDPSVNYTGEVFIDSNPVGYLQGRVFTPTTTPGESGSGGSSGVGEIIGQLVLLLAFLVSLGIVHGFHMMRDGIKNKETKTAFYGLLLISVVTFLPPIWFRDWGQFISFLAWMGAIVFLVVEWFLKRSNYVKGHNHHVGCISLPGFVSWLPGL